MSTIKKMILVLMALGAVLLLAAGAFAAPPMPTAPHPANSYAGLTRHVEKGGKGVLYLGVPHDGWSAGIWAKVDSLPGIPPGIYDCWLAENGENVMQVRVGTGPAPAAARAPAPGGVVDALDEVNAKRATRGLPPYVRDPGLTQAAMGAAKFRADRLIFGHIMNGRGYCDDMNFLPAGSTAASAGCAAYPASYGWMSCDIWERNRFGGAAWAVGRDGKRYMHLFIR